jgi:hypothetical protein
MEDDGRKMIEVLVFAPVSFTPESGRIMYLY